MTSAAATFDVEIHLADRPGELARTGHALAAAGISVEGGGMFVVGDLGAAHFLVHDGDGALTALRSAGLVVAACREVITLRLRQDLPGQLGAICGAMARAGVNIETLYSDHDGRLVLLVDDPDAAARVADEWTAAG